MTELLPSSPEVTILAGGWSAGRIDLTTVRGCVIGVNDAGVLAPRIDMVVSMDRLWSEYRWARLRDLRRTTWLRASTLQNIPDRSWPWLRLYECEVGAQVMSSTVGVLNGCSSGLVAMNLAYQMRPRQVWLMGMDHGRGPGGRVYWHDPYPWAPRGATRDAKYRQWGARAQQFVDQLRAAGASVVQVTDGAGIPGVRRVTTQEWARRAEAA